MFKKFNIILMIIMAFLLVLTTSGCSSKATTADATVEKTSKADIAGVWYLGGGTLHTFTLFIFDDVDKIGEDARYHRLIDVTGIKKTTGDGFYTIEDNGTGAYVVNMYSGTDDFSTKGPLIETHILSFKDKNNMEMFNEYSMSSNTYTRIRNNLIMTETNKK